MIFYKRLGQIKALSFDLDDTLYDNEPVINSAEMQFATLIQSRYRLSTESADRKFWDAERASLLKKNPNLASDMSMLRALSLMNGFKKMGHELTRDDADALTREFIRIRSEINVPNTTFALLRILRKKYTLAAISNGNSDIGQDGLDAFFDYDLRPNFYGCRAKPAADLFYEYAKVMNISTNEILHVGDDPITDVVGAVGAGCMCAWLEGGIAGRCVGIKALKILPHVKLSSLEELLTFLK